MMNCHKNDMDRFFDKAIAFSILKFESKEIEIAITYKKKTIITDLIPYADNDRLGRQPWLTFHALKDDCILLLSL